MELSRLVPARLREGAGVLRLRDYRNVFIAQSVSVFGDGITPVALTFAVVARPAPRTASAAAIPGLATGTPTMYEFSTDT